MRYLFDHFTLLVRDVLVRSMDSGVGLNRAGKMRS